MKVKRSYNKKSQYWENKGSKKVEERVEPALVGREAFARLRSHSSSNLSKREYRSTPIYRYEHIENAYFPFETKNGLISIKEIVEWCQKAYYNFSMIRNVVDLTEELCTGDIILKTSNSTQEEFFTAWLKKIDIRNLQRKYYIEKQRSSNIFLYRLDGEVRGRGKIPLKYIILNPANIALEAGQVMSMPKYERILSEFEIERLRNPLTEEDQQVYDALPEKKKQELKRGMYGHQGMTLELDPKKTYYFFHKKQDYEPFAVPLIFPVLKDINLKEEMKRIDQGVLRITERMVLLLTAGSEDNPQPETIRALQELMSSESLSRILVSDYTTKGEWLIPDISSILDPKKYDVVNTDIKEGLMAIFFSDGKFSDSKTKLDIFMNRIKEYREEFLNDFLNPELKRIAKEANFKGAYPEAEYEKVDLTDKTNWLRFIQAVAAMGLLTPDELFEAAQNGQLPEKQSSIESQKEYKELKDDGLYAPFQNRDSNDDGGNYGQDGGRPDGVSEVTTREGISSTNINKVLLEYNEVLRASYEKYKDINNITRLSEGKKKMARKFVDQMILNEPRESWDIKMVDYLRGKLGHNSEQTQEIDRIAAKYDLSHRAASLVFHAKGVK